MGYGGMILDPIHFGTDGWRAKIAETFTFPNVRRAAYGLGIVLRRRKKSSLVFVGYDTRFYSDKFAQAAGEVLASLGHRVVLSARFLPTPSLSLAIKAKKADAGVMITASHNSGAYNGFKIKLPPGVSAPSSFTQQVEKNIPGGVQPLSKKILLRQTDWLDFYLKTVKSKVDMAAIRRAGFKVVVDSMHGVGERHFEHLVSGGRTQVRTIAGERDVFFGGRQPEPIGTQLGPLSKAIRSYKADVGFATDGDGDRVGMVDEKGKYVDVHKLHALLLYHLWMNRGMRGGVVKTVSGTLMVERMAQKWGIPLTETPIGFKYIGEVMLKEDILLGVEESGGIAVKGHLAERDGLLSTLLLLEALAVMKKSVTGAVAFLQKEFGPYYSDRVDLKDISFDRQSRILSRLKKTPPLQVAGHKVTGVQTMDGVKLKLEKGWLLIRASGTEPLLRLYAEAPSPHEVRSLLNAAKSSLLANL
jgi:phosphomannomutase